MRFVLASIILVTLFSCSTELENNSAIDQPVEDTVQYKVANATEEEVVEVPILPFFELQFLDEEFKAFYYDLINSCYKKDTVAVLNAIHDTLRFSKYECAYGMYLNAGCEGCTRCSKKGMLMGIFSGADAEQICERLYDMITRYGVGSAKNNELYYKWLMLDSAHVNFNFKNWEQGAKYFDYSMIIPKQEEIKIREHPNQTSKEIATFPFEMISYSNEPGMGEYDDETGTSWYEYDGGYINGSQVLTGFDFTLVIFEKTHQGWKITGFIQPPGC